MAFDTSRPMRLIGKVSGALNTAFLVGLVAGQIAAPTSLEPPIRVQSARGYDVLDIEAMQARTGADTEGRAKVSRDGSCFGQQMGEDAAASNVRRSVLFIASIDPRTSRATGEVATAFVVADSAPRPRGLNRMLTARHVVTSPSKPGESASFAVFGSDGKFVGLATTLAQGRSWHAAGHPEGYGHGDGAVLEMISFTKGMRAKYAAIAGLQLAREQPRGTFQGVSSGPSGVTHGNSGGPALDADYRVRGIVSAASGDIVGKESRFTAVSGSILGMISSHGRFATTRSSLPLVSAVIVETIPPELFPYLGKAGKGLDGGGTVAALGQVKVTLPGYSEGEACMVSHAVLGLNGEYEGTEKFSVNPDAHEAVPRQTPASIPGR